MSHTLGQWSDAENQYIIAHYGTTTLRAIADALSVDVYNLRAHASWLRKVGRLTLEERHYGRLWTVADDQELRGRWNHERATMLARSLHRSLAAVRNRAAKLKLGRGGPGLTACAAAHIFGVDAHLVVYWIEHGWLQAKQTRHRAGRGYRWVITLEAVEDFIRATPYHFDWRAMSPDTAWREFARHETERQGWLTPLQASKRLGCHVGTVHQHLRKCWLPSVKTAGPSWQGDYRIRESDLAQFKPRRPLGGHGGRGRPGMRRKVAA